MIWRLDVDMMARRIALSLFCILVGYSIYGVYALGFRFRFGLPTEVYWLSFVFVSIPLLCEVVFWKSSPKLRLLYLLFFSLMMHLQYVVVDSSPLLLSEDAVAEYRLTDKIMADLVPVRLDSTKRRKRIQMGTAVLL